MAACWIQGSRLVFGNSASDIYAEENSNRNSGRTYRARFRYSNNISSVSEAAGKGESFSLRSFSVEIQAKNTRTEVKS